MASPEFIEEIDGSTLPPRRPNLSLLGGQVISSSEPIEHQLPQEYVPYDGTHPLINEAGWMYMNYQQLELVRHRLSLSLRDLLHHRSQAEAAKQWDRMSILEPQFNIIVSKISWVNGMLRDRRQ